MKSCHVKCTQAYSFTQSCQEAASCFQPLSRWCPRHVPLLTWGWKQEAASLDSSWEVGMGLDQKTGQQQDGASLNAGWWVWPLSFSPGNKARQGRVRESGHRTAGERQEDWRGQAGWAEGKGVNHDSKVSNCTQDLRKECFSYFVFLKTDTCRPLCLSQNRVSVKKYMLTEEGIWGEYP